MPTGSFLTMQPNDTNENSILQRALNTAIVSSLVETDSAGPASKEISALSQGPEVRVLLGAIQALAKEQNISLEIAGERLITVIRKLDRSWTDYLMRQGVRALKGRS